MKLVTLTCAAIVLAVSGTMSNDVGAQGRYGGVVDLVNTFRKADPWEKAYPDGSLQRSQTRTDGTTHTTIINRQDRSHYSYDTSPNGTHSGQHWTYQGPDGTTTRGSPQ